MWISKQLQYSKFVDYMSKNYNEENYEKEEKDCEKYVWDTYNDYLITY